MYQHILVPLDGSHVAEEALPYGVKLRQLSGGTLTLARIIPSAIEPPARYSIADAEPWLMRQHQMREEAEAYLAHIAARPDVGAARPYTHVAAGEVGYCLLALIEREGIEVVVMTIRHRRHLARWVLGDIADYMVEHAPIPVLLVRHHEG